ncbi:MAG: cysteine-rich CWC family protein [Prevotella sp.]|nr:cysteine-rich CWC family protein [Prevotella sp.]
MLGRCPAVFSCREDRVELCSCRKISIASVVRDYIEDNYSGCLCPECLEETNVSFYAFDVNPGFLSKSKND